MNDPYLAYLVAQDEQQRISGGVTRLAGRPLAADEVAIDLVYSSLNYKDALALTQRGKILRRLPLVPGIDGAGRVRASRDSRFRPGDAVLVTGCGLGEERDGGFSERLTVAGAGVIPLPPGLSLREAMILGTAGFSAALALQRLQDNHLRPDQGPVLVTGASGGVGGLAIALLKRAGYRVTAFTHRRQHADYLRTLGADEILVADAVPLGTRPLESARWAAAIDTLGGETLAWLTRTVMPWGSIACIGLAAGSELHTTVMPFILRGISLLGVSSANCPLPWRQVLWQRLAQEWKPPSLESLVGKTIGLESLFATAEDLLAGRLHGRVLVRLAADQPPPAGRAAGDLGDAIQSP